MTLAIPTPATIAQRFAAWLEQSPVLADDGTSVTLDANAPGSLEQVLAAVIAMEMAGVYRYARDWCLELMPTTATEEGLLPQHAVEWSTPRIPAQSAVGNVLMTLPAGSAPVVVPIDQMLTVDGTVSWRVRYETTLAAGSVTSVPVQATSTGTIGNLAAGTSVTAVTPIAGVSAIVVDDSGLAGGAPEEAVESWRPRILEAIRNPSGGGTSADYVRWAKAAGATYAKVIPGWLGAGSVGVIVAMADRGAPTTSELATIAAYMEDVSRRIVRANLTLAPASVAPQDVSLSIVPDTVANRADVMAALAAYYNSTDIGDVLYHSRLEDAVLSVTSVTSSLIISPAGNVTLANSQLAVLGNIDWQASS